MVVNLIAALAATAGYSLLVNVPRRLLAPAALGGVLSWGAYLLLRGRIESVFYLLVLVGAASAAYAEAAAKAAKAPATIFLIPGLIPLVPGGYVYYAMFALVQNDFAAMRRYGLLTAQWAVGLAAGISLVAVLHQIAGNLRAKSRKTT